MYLNNPRPVCHEIQFKKQSKLFGSPVIKNMDVLKIYFKQKLEKMLFQFNDIQSTCQKCISKVKPKAKALRHFKIDPGVKIMHNCHNCLTLCALLTTYRTHYFTSDWLKKTTVTATFNSLEGDDLRLINNNRYYTRCCLFKIQGFFVYNNPEAETQWSSAQAALNNKTKREHALPARNSFGLLSQGYCERKTPKS